MRPRTEIGKEESAAIKVAMQTARNRSSFQRLQCLWLRASQYLATSQIAQIVGLSESHIRRVWSDYFQRGLVGGAGRPKGGRRHQHLSIAAERELLQPFEQAACAGRALTARALKRVYEERIGKVVPDSTVCRLLARQGWRRVQPRPKHPRSSSRVQTHFKKRLLERVQAVAASYPQVPLRLMFEDEARFGRMTDPVRCWAPRGCRPVVSLQRVREYTHVFGAVCPHDGQMVSLILPDADTAAMAIFLAEVARCYPAEHILMFLDRAGWHCAKRLCIPDNITLAWLPPYSPECNPQELVWRELRGAELGNREFASLSAVEDTLTAALRRMIANPERIRSLTGFDWIVNVILNAN